MMKLRLLRKASSLITPLAVVRNDSELPLSRRGLHCRIMKWYMKHEVERKVNEEARRRQAKKLISWRNMRAKNIEHDQLRRKFTEEIGKDENVKKSEVWKDRLKTSIISANMATEEARRDERVFEETYHDITREIAKEVYGRKPNKVSENELRYSEGASNLATYIRKCGIGRPELAYGWTILMRMRVGRYWNAQRLSRGRVISRRLGKECPFCRDGPENDTHIIFHCKEWELIRVEMMERMPKEVWIDKPPEEYEDWREHQGWTTNAKRFIAAVLNFPMKDIWKGILNDDDDDEAIEEEKRVGPTTIWCLRRETDEWKEGIVTAITYFLRKVSPARFNWLSRNGILSRRRN